MNANSIDDYHFDFSEWTTWPDEDVKLYAREIATDGFLSEKEAASLELNMLGQAELHRPAPADAATRKAQDGWQPEITVSTFGDGLSRRTSYVLANETRWLRKERKHKLRQVMRTIPFSFLQRRIDSLANEAMWRGNCYKINWHKWLFYADQDKPYEGSYWYARELQMTYDNARRQVKLGNIEAAMRHAFRAGELKCELEMIMAHGLAYKKYESTVIAQRESIQDG